jgi:hypothetical protein
MLVHTAEELEGQIGEPITAREQLHAWVREGGDHIRAQPL